METKILNKAIRTLEKFRETVRKAEGFDGHERPDLNEMKMMLTMNDGMAFVFELQKDEGEEDGLKSIFAILKEDEEGNLHPVSIQAFGEEAEDDALEQVLLN